jgi:hypothetical protein
VSVGTKKARVSLTQPEQECLCAIHHIICTKRSLPSLEVLAQVLNLPAARIRVLLNALGRKQLIDSVTASAVSLSCLGIQTLEELGLHISW